jgi:hypothetical protein
MSAADTRAFAELMGDICFAGSACDSLYPHVQKFHRPGVQLTAHLEAGGTAKTFTCRIIKRLLDKIIMPANWLMYRLDPDGSRTLAYMHNALRPYYRDYQIFLEQHEPKAKAVVEAWDFETYLDILDTANVITRIDNKKEELWGVAERLRRAYPALPERAGVGSIPANPDAQNVPSFRRWRFGMKLSPFLGGDLYFKCSCKRCGVGCNSLVASLEAAG